MVIRPFRAEDGDAVVEIVQSVFHEYGFTWEADGYCLDLYTVEESYPPPDAFWVAEHDGEVVGCVGLCLHDRLPGDVGRTTVVDGDVRAAGTDCELVRLYIKPEARGQGLGRRLTEHVQEQARRAGRESIELWSDKKLTHAHAMYERLGAVRIGDRICPGDPDQSCEWGFALPVLSVSG